MKNSEVVKYFFENKVIKNKSLRVINTAISIKSLINSDTTVAVKIEKFVFINSTYFSCKTTRHIKSILANKGNINLVFLNIKNLHLWETKELRLHILMEFARSHLVREILDINHKILEAKKSKELKKLLKDFVIFDSFASLNLSLFPISTTLKDLINKREKLLKKFPKAYEC